MKKQISIAVRALAIGLVAVLLLVSLAGIGAAVTSISFGQTLSGTINAAAQMDDYTFSASANDNVVFRVSKTSGTLYPGIRLRGPDGTNLKEIRGPTTAEISYKLPSSGMYIISTYDGWDGTRTGGYTLHLQRVNNPGSATPISFGQTLSNNINAAAQMDAYTFSASANDNVVFRVSKTSGTLYPGIRLYGPDGTNLKEIRGSTTAEISYKLPSSGMYIISTYDGWDGTRTGGYTLHLQRVNNPGSATPISFGQTLSNNINAAAQMDAYTFSASANDNVVFRVSKTSGTLYPGIRLYGPDGSNLKETRGSTTAEISYKLPSSGTYTISTYDGWDGTRTGGYNIYLGGSPATTTQTPQQTGGGVVYSDQKNAIITPTTTPTPISTTQPTSASKDSDGDGWSDDQELAAGTNPLKADTDGDGVWDSKDSNPLVFEKSEQIQAGEPNININVENNNTITNIIEKSGIEPLYIGIGAIAILLIGIIAVSSLRNDKTSSATNINIGKVGDSTNHVVNDHSTTTNVDNRDGVMQRSNIGGSSGGIDEKLSSLKDKYEKGLISEDIYKEMQKELLGKM